MRRVAAFVVATNADKELLVASDFPKLWGIASFFQPLGGAFGYTLSTLARLEMADRRAVCLETGVQSYPLVMALVGLSWTGCTKIQVRAFVIIATFWYLISTAWMVPFIQLVTVEDSCLLRCFRRPSTLNPKLPAVQSTEEGAAPAKAGEGAARRQAGLKEVLKQSKYDGLDNCYALFARAARLYPNNYCFGWRTTLASGNAGAFVWMTYRETHEQVLQLASGVARVQVAPPSMLTSTAKTAPTAGSVTAGASAIALHWTVALSSQVAPIPLTPLGPFAPPRRQRTFWARQKKVQ